MPENDYELEHKEAQSVNAQTWQDMGNSGDTSNTNQTNNLALVSENIPQLSKEEQTVLEEKRNDPEFQKGLNKILPTGNGNKEDTNANNVNLSDLIKQWQNENKDSDKDNSKESPKENKTGLPDELKSGMEALSGINLDDIKVYYNSSLPAEYNALAYAQGTDIHIGPGQKQHLAHEAWHVVQQKQGLVKATMEMKDGVGVNDDDGLEKEADVMGGKAMNPQSNENSAEINESESKDITKKNVRQNSPIQRVIVYKPKKPITKEDYEAIATAIHANGDLSYLKKIMDEDKEWSIPKVMKEFGTSEAEVDWGIEPPDQIVQSPIDKVIGNAEEKSSSPDSGLSSATDVDYKSPVSMASSSNKSRLPKSSEIAQAVDSFDPDEKDRKLLSQQDGSYIITRKICDLVIKPLGLNVWESETVFSQIHPLVKEKFFAKNNSQKVLKVNWKCSAREAEKAKAYAKLEERLNTKANYDAVTGKPGFNNAHADNTRKAQWKLQADVVENGAGSKDRLHINVTVTADEIIVDVIALSLDTH